MRVLLIGTGGVGEAIAKIGLERDWLELLVLADFRVERAREVQAMLGDLVRFPVEWLDARDRSAIVALARKYRVGLIMNAVDPVYNDSIFGAAFDAGVNYMDMALSLSTAHPSEPHRLPGAKLGDDQFAMHDAWEQAGRLALVGMGVEPGVADVFARHAQDVLFEEIEEVGVRDGSNLVVDGYEFAPSFSIWTTIEECLNPPVIWEKERGWYTTAPFSDPEIFDFPEGIGPVEVVNVEHEEVILVPRWLKAGRVTFKYGLGDKFISVLRTLHMLGLDSTRNVRVGGAEVSPRDVVAAVLPDPARLGAVMHGKTCAGTWVKGSKNGRAREVYLYQVADNDDCMKRWGCQAVVAQTAVGPVIAMELIERGLWRGVGVLGPEAFPASPFLERMANYGFPYAVRDSWTL